MPTRTPALALCVLTAFGGTAVAASPGQFDLPPLPALAARASDETTLTVPGSLLRLMAAGSPADADARQAIAGLEAVQIRSYSFADDHAYTDADVSPVRRQLDSGHWSPVVRSHSSKDGEQADVYVCLTERTACGIVVLVTAPREFTVVHVAGAVPLAALDNLRQLVPATAGAGH